MKIACISTSQIPSSTANSIQVMKACQALSQLGNEVHLFVPKLKEQAEGTDLSTFYGLKNLFDIHWLPSRKSFRRYDFSAQAAWKARRMKADLAYVWALQAGVFSLMARLPVIIELHGPPEGKNGPRLFSRFLRMKGKKRLLPITRALASQLQAGFKLNTLDTSLVRVCPNGVDLERYNDLPDTQVARDLLGLSPAMTAVYTGHLYPGRGMDLLLELAKCFPRIKFLWVGGHPDDVKTWKERIKADGLRNIIITGFVQNSQLPLYQAAADILLMPYEKVITGSSGGDSATYASPMKMFEYMASKRAIISSDLPVIREVLNPSNAILCPAEDIEAWSQALASLITDKGQRLALAEQAWQDIQQYTWQERARKALDGFC